MAIGGSSNDLEIKVRVDADGAVQTFDRLGKAVDGSQGRLTELNQALELVEKAFKAIGATVGAAFEALERGSAVDDVSQAFDRLSDEAGIVSKTFLNDLQRATVGTVSNFELLTKANQALRAGLTADQFTDVASAARVLAEDGIGSLTENMETLSRALTSGRTAQLRQLKIFIDQDEAARKFTGGLVNLASELDEEGRILAIQNAVSEKYNEIAAESARLTLDAGDKIGQFKTALENAKDEMFQAAANNKELNELLDALVRIVNSIDFSTLISQVSQLATAFIQAGGAVVDFAQKLNANKGFQKAAEDVDSILGTMALGLKEFFDPTVINEGVDIIQDAKKATLELANATDELGKAGDKAGEAKKKHTKAIRDYIAGSKAGTKETITAAQAQIKLNNDFKQLLTNYAKGIVSLDAYTAEVAQLRAEFTKTGGAASDFARITSDVTKSLDATLAGAGDVADAVGEIGKEFDATGAGLEALFGGLTDALNGNFEDILGNALGSFGGSLGAATGIPGLDQLGAAIGQKLGDAITEGIESVFGGRDAQGAIRDSMDALFAGYFEDNPFQVLIGEALSSINDLEFGRGTDAYSTGAFDDLLQSLGPELQRAFEAAGLAFSQFVEGGSELSSQLAAVLANNVGGSLNNLQVLIEATGQSFETLRDSIIETFLDGEITITQAAEALLGLQQLAEGGIPGAIGDVTQAFNNLQAALQDGAKGGRYAVDAIRDIAAEAKELGINTLPQLASALVNTFGFSADVVAQFFQALQVAGIQTLDQLAQASAETAIAIGANFAAIQQGQTPTFSGNIEVETPSYSSGGGGSSSSAASSAKSAQGKRKREREQARRELTRLVEGTQDYKTAVTSLNAGLIDSGQAFNIINNLYAEGRALKEDLTKAEKAFNKEISEETTKNLLNAKKALDEFTGTAPGKGPQVNEALLNFARKFADNIDLINVAAGRAGISFKQLQQSAIDAFLAGRTTIDQAVGAINDSGPGIAGKRGAVGDAFGNLRNLGTRGGALSVDALRDIAAEAIELGGKNLDELLSSASAAGVDPKQIQQLISVLQAQGISSLEQLVNASDETAIRILGGLSELAFPFSETSDAVLTLLDDLNKIPDSKSVDLVLNLKTGAIDPALMALLERLGIDIPEVLPGYGSSTDSPGLGTGNKKNKKNKKNKRRK